MFKFASLFVSLGLLSAACSRQTPASNDWSNVKIVDDSLVGTDLMSDGSLSVLEAEYSSTATYDNDVYSGARTDIRGRIFLPETSGPVPVIVFLHGNHATCGMPTGAGNPRLDLRLDFTSSGRCPSGYVEVPSYRGYDESARQLASHGYAVVSINANRGITGANGSSSDPGLIQARGNLVLKTLEELSELDTSGRSDRGVTIDGLELGGKLDFSRVGLMGHSRGGEGVRYAYNTFKSSSTWASRIPGLAIKGIFEIGPVDMGTNNGRTKVEAYGTAWTVLIPGCDMDVLDFQGVNAYGRMLEDENDGLPKSVFTLWGANHNFFNTEWQVSDAPHRCIGEQEPLWNTKGSALTGTFANLDANARQGLTGSDTQIDVAKGLMLAFYESHLGNRSQLKNIFDPQYRLPRQISNLAPSSREFFLASDSVSVFDPEKQASGTNASGVKITGLRDHVNAQLKLLNSGLKEAAEENGTFSYTASLYGSSFPRPAIAIEAAAGSSRTVSLPLTSAQSTSGIWTIDLAVAVRKGCYSFDSSFVASCRGEDLANDFQVALELEDGSVTKSVAVSDYIELANWYSDYLTRMGSSGATLYYSFVPTLYQNVRFELSDFGSIRGRIKGVRLTFDQGKEVALLVESIRLTESPK